jgi:hypothetical protein
MEVCFTVFTVTLEADFAGLYPGFERQINIKQGLVSPGLFDLFDVFRHSDLFSKKFITRLGGERTAPASNQLSIAFSITTTAQANIVFDAVPFIQNFYDTNAPIGCGAISKPHHIQDFHYLTRA